MALWVGISISLTCLVLGYAIACWVTSATQSDLEEENWHLEIENARLKRGNP